jgi:adenylate kinase
MKNIILLGAPGAGKGTLAKDLCPALKIKHISTGDLLREVIASGSALGKELNSYVSTGALVPDALIGKMIKETLASKECRQGVLLDGFPRTVPQADMLEQIMKDLNTKIEKVFYLSIPLDRVIKRLVNRWSCPNCGRPYHLINLPPKKSGECDDCHVKLTQREDDKEETIRKRFNTFLEKTQPLIDYYKKKNILTEVNATDNAPETLAAVMALL